MSVTHRIARSFIAPIFVSGGMDALRNPDEKAKNADQVIRRIASKLGLPDDPIMLVRINGGVQLAAGAMLAVGWAPRLSSGVLAASLVPTTVAGHRFWDEPDPQKKAAQRIELLKNLAMLGGLVLATTDHDGKPSLTWRAKRSAANAADRASSVVSSAAGRASGHSHDASSSAIGLGEKAMAAAAVLGERALQAATAASHAATSAASDAASSVADVVSNAADAVGSAAGSAADAVSARVGALAS